MEGGREGRSEGGRMEESAREERKRRVDEGGREEGRSEGGEGGIKEEK